MPAFCIACSEEATAVAQGVGGTWKVVPEGGHPIPPRSHPWFAAGTTSKYNQPGGCQHFLQSTWTSKTA